MNIDEAWGTTCKVLLGDEIGDINQYRAYLTKYVELPIEKKSISGQKIFFSSQHTCKDAKFISNEEIDNYKMNGTKIDINKIKDIDSILEALAEEFYYSGNIVLGNSKDVYNSDRCSDAIQVYESSNISSNAKYIVFSNSIRGGEYNFGCGFSAESKFIIRGFSQSKSARCMEALRMNYLSDCYFVSNLFGCQNCMFSFNLRNANYRIGNLQLSKDKYAKIKEKLIEDIRETLRNKKTIPTIIDIIGGSQKNPGVLDFYKKPKKDAISNSASSFDMIQKEFESTCKVILGKPIGQLTDYEKWLNRYIVEVIECKSAVSEEIVYAPKLPFFIKLRDHLVKLDESLELGKTHIEEYEAESINISNASEKLKTIAYATPEKSEGVNMNVIKSTYYDSIVNSYSDSFAHHSKNTAYSFWPKLSENIFGSYMAFYSNYCIKCYNSTYLTRCFEMDSSHKCRDSYFCHNCENLDNAMFCFNTKSKRYAIGNKEIGYENYMKIKKIVLDEITKKLEKDKDFELSIYNIGCKTR